jgi:hypothetical protein
MATYGATDTTPCASTSDLEDPAANSHSSQAATAKNAPANMVQVYVCDYNGFAWTVKVTKGVTMSELVNTAIQNRAFETRGVIGFEDGTLTVDRLVTTADAARWTAANPLRLKYKVRTSNHTSIIGSAMVLSVFS